ncbi:hypothetical protein BGP_3662 [Beggiatoa sp. PS]|nr:hypothetical protein BGP_3662 [Beggiatoa sp. PS]
MTQWTSFVAVEEKIVNVDGKPQTVVQPVEIPEGVSYEGIFGEDQPASVPMAMSKGISRSAIVSSLRSRPMPQSIVESRQYAAPLSSPPPRITSRITPPLSEELGGAYKVKPTFPSSINEDEESVAEAKKRASTYCG